MNKRLVLDVLMLFLRSSDICDAAAVSDVHICSISCTSTFSERGPVLFLVDSARYSKSVRFFLCAIFLQVLKLAHIRISSFLSSYYEQKF